MEGDPSNQGLVDELDRALREERLADALGVYEALEAAEPSEPRWPHRRGDLLERLARRPEAIAAYERAVDGYARLGFLARAAAMAKVILGLDPGRRDVLERIDPEEARRLHRKERRPLVVDSPGGDAPRTSLMKEALSLRPAANAGEDEVRFENVTAADGAVLEATRREAGAAPAKHGAEILLDLEDADARPSASELARMPSVPLFAEVPREVLVRLVAHAELVHLRDGEALLRVGEPSDALFTVVSGRLRVDVPELGAGAATLGEGDVAGESCLLDEVSRRADVIAVGPVQALRMQKAVLDALVAEHPALGEVLLELLGRRLIDNLLQTSPLFAAFDPGTRAELATLFELRRADEGVHLLEAGKRSDGLYVPLLGRLERVEADGRVSTVPLGETLGQLSLITHQPADHTVTARTEALLLRLPASRFTRLAALYPPVLAHLTELAATLGA